MRGPHDLGASPHMTSGDANRSWRGWRAAVLHVVPGVDTLAAAAERSDTVVLHHDHGFDRISQLTGQPTEWIAPLHGGSAAPTGRFGRSGCRLARMDTCTGS